MRLAFMAALTLTLNSNVAFAASPGPFARARAAVSSLKSFLTGPRSELPRKVNPEALAPPAAALPAAAHPAVAHPVAAHHPVAAPAEKMFALGGGLLMSESARNEALARGIKFFSVGGRLVRIAQEQPQTGLFSAALMHPNSPPREDVLNIDGTPGRLEELGFAPRAGRRVVGGSRPAAPLQGGQPLKDKDLLGFAPRAGPRVRGVSGQAAPLQGGQKISTGPDGEPVITFQ